MSSQNARINMVKQQLRTGDVLEEAILDLFDMFSRHEFVPPAMKEFAYSDMQIPLAHGQKMMTPLEEGTLLQALALDGHETVLEVGTGSGYLTALLSRLCQKVISVDYYADLTNDARAKLEKYHCHNVELITGDGSRGWLDKAPYDVVLLTGAVDAVTETHRLQVLPGGKLFAIVGRAPVMQGRLYTLDHQGNWSDRLLFETNLPPLIDKLKPKEFVF
ncbi:methyltransferase domain-containing protein [Legionella sp. MW5194]|uniref:protein-L-isoaspartate O-methyltransferase family protein n=1 Tax=Legionella sp. MW5194 TaxID=2662448 RepID=UPI00193D8B17|nr:protein-L-isoaspartate O-methyltransferase [Legionella sp. MW5194]QRN04399.1 methyltransferase domain-containing protein [Legionella sp. MW5194]